ncbi:MAG: trypsin-like peptidase domain-containing protein [Candidatus Gastranaerophilales bacterium]|nr:trypsin-like peptidase domain-containing protein [Candidatus Gastranaerophilales bacterium]
MQKVILYILFGIQLFIPSFAFDRDEITNINVYEKINPAIVAIDAKIPHGTSSGTGCIIDSKGTILTSSHVIGESSDITVTVSNGEKYKAQIIKIAGISNDLALLRINTTRPLKTITFGDSTSIRVGQKVLAIGNPFGFNGTLTQGIVSRIDYKRNKIQTDAAINPGSSGGPLLNTSGEVIGINQAIYNPDNNTSNIGIGFAIPINAVKSILP